MDLLGRAHAAPAARVRGEDRKPGFVAYPTLCRALSVVLDTGVPPRPASAKPRDLGQGTTQEKIGETRDSVPSWVGSVTSSVMLALVSRFIGVGGASLRPPWALTFVNRRYSHPQPQHTPEWRLGVVWRKVPFTQWRAGRAVCSQPSAHLICAGSPELSGAQLRPGVWGKNSLKGEARRSVGCGALWGWLASWRRVLLLQVWGSLLKG